MLKRLGLFGGSTRSDAVARPVWLRLLVLVLFAISLPGTGLRAQDGAAQPPKDIQPIIARGIMRVAITAFDLPAFHWLAQA